MEVRPLKDEVVIGIRAQQYIEFKWYVWKSHRKALVKYASKEGAAVAMEAFKANPELDGIKVKVTHDEGTNSLILDQLNPTTD
jgi:predicted RNA binding protein with dsRBD fold (UPF0201 family)